MPVRKKRIESLARQILHDNGIIEPPVPVEALSKKHGLQIRFQPLESDLSGFLFHDEHQAVVGVNSYHPKVRQRFTMAHELGHFLLHQKDAVHVDRAVLAKLRSPLSSQSVDPDEIEANYFAAELLMPRDLMARELERIDAVDIVEEDIILDIARRFKVSAQALVLRLINLGYVEH